MLPLIKTDQIDPEDQQCPYCGEDLPSLFVATMHFKRCELRNSQTEPSED